MKLSARRILCVLALLVLWASGVSAQTLGTGTITTNGGVFALKIEGANIPSVGIALSGTWTGTLSFYEATEAACSNTQILQAFNVGSGSSAVSATANALFAVPNQGLRWVCVKATASMTGTASVSFIRGDAGGGAGGGGADFTGDITGDITVGDVGITSIAAGDTNIGNVDIASIAAGDTNIGNVDLASAIPAGNNNIGDIDIATIAAGNNNIGDVDVASSALPTGASTSAKQDTGNTSLSSIDGKITAVNTGAVVIASGTVTAVTAITNALPSGTNAIGKLAENSGVDIGDVDVTSSALPTGASTSTNQTTEITALQLIDNPIGSSTGGTAGTSSGLAGGIYNSSNPTLTNGQQAGLQLDSTGALRVAGAAGGTSSADNSAFTTGTTSLTAGGGLYDATPDSLTDGRTGVFALTIKRALHTSLFDTTGTSAFGTAGSSATPVLSVQGIASGTALPVSIATVPSHAVTNAGTFAVQESGAGLTSLQLIDNLPNTIGSTTSGQYGALVQGAVTTAAPTYSSTQTHPLSLSTTGSLRVEVTNAATGGTSVVDDADFTQASTQGTPAVGVYESTPTSITDGDLGIVGLTQKRAQRVSLETAAGVPITQDTQFTHATTLGTITSVTGGGLMGNASTATPTDVGADGDAALLWLTRNGALNVADAGGSLTVDGTVTVTATNLSTNVAQINGVTPLMGNGASGTGAQRVTIANDSTGVLATVSTVTSLSQFGGQAIALNSGNTSAGTLRSIEATDSQLSAGVGATGDSAATAGSTGSINAKLRLLTTQVAAVQTAVELIDNDQTGWTPAAVISAASTNDTVVKSSAGRISSINLVNTTATLYYLRLYDIASGDATCSSATGYLVSLPVPASTTGSGFTMSFPSGGIAFASGIGYCLTGGSSSTDNTNAATGIFGIISFK